MPLSVSLLLGLTKGLPPRSYSALVRGDLGFRSYGCQGWCEGMADASWMRSTDGDVDVEGLLRPLCLSYAEKGGS